MKWYQVKFINIDGRKYKIEWYGKKWHESYYNFIERIKERSRELKINSELGENLIEDIKRIT